MNSTTAYVFCLKGTSKLQHREGGTQMEPSNLTELRNQRLELGEAEMASIWGTKYPREGSIRVSLSLWLNTNLCMCRMKTHEELQGKNNYGEAEKRTIHKTQERGNSYQSEWRGLNEYNSIQDRSQKGHTLGVWQN